MMPYPGADRRRRAFTPPGGDLSNLTGVRTPEYRVADGPDTVQSAAPAKRGRPGAAVIEFAVIAPVMLLLVLGMIEFGRMMMVQEVLANGAREGARKAVLPGATDTQVYQTIDDYMSNSGISGYTRTCSPSAGSAQGGTAITVTVSVPYNNVTWLPVGNLTWLQNKNLSTSVVMRKEEY